jgi:hypothetical protein
MFLLVSPLLDEVFEVLDVADVLDLLALHESGAVDGFAVGLLDQVDSRILRNLDGAQKTGLLRHLADNPQGVQLVNELGAGQTKELFSLAVSNTDNVQLRGNLFTVYGQGVPAAEIDSYLTSLSRARQLDNINNRPGLVNDISGSGITPEKFQGQRGEAASAIRYADDGGEVTVEPGQGNYDIAVSRGSTTEYIEVKTRTTGDIDFLYARGKISDMNRKFDKALSDPGVNPSSNDVVLEIRAKSTSSSLDEIRGNIQDALGDSQRVKIDKIRVIMDDGRMDEIIVADI